jgi:hypothetical protein
MQERLIHQWVVGLFLSYVLIPCFVLPGALVVMAQEDHELTLESSWRELVKSDSLQQETLEYLESLTPTVIVDATDSPTSEYNASSFPSPSPTSLLQEIEGLSSSPTITANNAPDTNAPTFFPTRVELPEPQEPQEDNDEDGNEPSQPTNNSAATGHGILGLLYGNGWYPRIVFPTVVVFLVGLPAVLVL